MEGLTIEQWKENLDREVSRMFDSHHEYHLPGPAVQPQVCTCLCGRCEKARKSVVIQQKGLGEKE